MRKMNFQTTDQPPMDLNMIVVDEMIEEAVDWDLPPLPVVAWHPVPRKQGVKRT